MGFFEDLTKTVSRAGQDAVGRAKEIADNAKLSSMIGDEEKRMRENYLTLGKLYCQKRGDCPEEPFAPFVQEIADSQGKIAAYREQIKRNNGMMTCPACGETVPLTAKFCNGCGKAMPTE